MLTLLCWIATATVLATYAYSAKTGKIGPFNWANAVGCIPLGFSNLLHFNLPQFILSVFFGAIGLYGITTSLREQVDVQAE